MLISIRGFRRRGLLILLLLGMFLTSLATVVDAGERLLPIPILCVYAAALLRWLWQKGMKRQWPRLVMAVVMVVAIAAASFLPEVPVGDPAGRVMAGNALRSAGDLVGAITQYDRVLEGSKDFAWAYLEKGRATLGAKDKTRAVALFRKALWAGIRQRQPTVATQARVELSQLGIRTQRPPAEPDPGRAPDRAAEPDGPPAGGRPVESVRTGGDVIRLGPDSGSSIPR